MDDFKIAMVVEVESLVADKILDEEDQAIAGKYLLDVAADNETSSDDLEQLALDYFHDHIGIHTLDHFGISVREAEDDDFDDDEMIGI